jgi:hypothetical protein
MKISELADQVRDIPLRDVLERYGFEPRREGTTLRAKSLHHNIVVTGGRWFDNKANIGGGGAIDLVMHLGGVDFMAACISLVDQFRPLAAGQSDLSFPSSSQRQPAPRKKPFEELMALYAARDDSNWPIARAYLIEQRKTSAGLVDELHASVRSTPTAICPIRASYSCIVTSMATFAEQPCGIPGTSRPSVRALETSSARGLLSVISPKPSAWWRSSLL